MRKSATMVGLEKASPHKTLQKFHKRWLFTIFSLLLMTVALGINTQAQTLETQFYQGFEVDNSNWFSPAPTRTASGAIPASTGGFYGAVGSNNSFTRWGGYSSVFPARGYATSVDIYLNMSGGYTNDTRANYTSAISDTATPTSNHRRDFVFSFGFYNDGGPYGTGNRFVMSASNNSPGNPRDAGRSPFTISTTGWYKFQHRFYDNGSGVLAVDMSVIDSLGNVLNTWTLSEPTDVIGSTVGGNRYGWFPSNGFSDLAIDNSQRANFVETLVVDDDLACPGAAYSTIKLAITAASSGDTIEVCAGTYTEDIFVTKSLKILGPNVGISPNGGTRVAEAIVQPLSTTPTARVFTANVANTTFTIDGFTLQNGSPLHDGNQTGVQTVRGMFRNNIIQNGGVIFIGSFNQFIKLSILDNSFSNINQTPISSAIQINGGGEFNISGNSIDTTSYAGILIDSVNTATVYNNKISNTPYQGIQLAFSVNTANVFANVLTNTNTLNDPNRGAIRMYGTDFTGINNVACNSISNSFVGVIVKSGEDITGKSINIFGNKLLGNSNAGVRNNGTGTLNAENNFYNSTSGPTNAGNPGGTGDAVIGDVDFTPFLTSTSSTSCLPGNYVITSANPQGWGFLNETPNGTGSYVFGPATTPAGTGSAKLNVDSTGGHILGKLDYAGIRLDQITQLSYSSYQNNNTNTSAAIAFQFNLDEDLTDGNTAFQGRLVFEPTNDTAQAVQQGVWQSWNVLSPTAKFWASPNANSTIDTACPQSNPCTLAQVLSAFPNIGIHASPTLGAVLFKVGGGLGSPFEGNVDAFTIGINNAQSTFDFEPTPLSVTINQASGQFDPTSTSPVNFTVVFSEPVADFDASDVTISGTATGIGKTVSGSGTTYNVAVSVTGSGTVIADIPAGGATATSSGTPNTVSTSTDNTVAYFTCADITTDSTTTLTGVPKDIAVKTTDLTGRGVIAADFTFTYDHTVLSLNGTPTAGSVWSSADPVVTVSSPSLGVLNVSVYGSNATPEAVGAGSLIDLHFNVIGAIGSTSPLAVSNFLYNGGLHCISAPMNGTLTVISGTITGQVSYGNPATSTQKVANVLLNAPGTPLVSGTTNGSGNYSLSGFGSGSYTVTPSKTRYAFGTSGASTQIFSNDSTLIVQHVVGITTLNTTQLVAAKVSGTATTTLSSFDAALISQWIVGINPTNPINNTGRWTFTPPSVNHGVVNASAVQNYTAILLGDVSGSWTNLGTNLVEPEPLTAPTKESVNASIPRMKASAGSSLVVPFRIDNLKDRQVDSYQFDIEYDPDVLEAGEVGASIAGTNSEGLTVVSNSPKPGLLKVVVYGAWAVSGDGVYVNLNFSTVGRVGSSTPLTIRGFRINNGTDEVYAEEGEVTLAAANNTIRGKLYGSADSNMTVSNARVTVTSSAGATRTVVTGSFGSFEFGDLDANETYTISVEARRHRFTPVTVTMTGNVVDLKLTADQ